MIDCNPNLIKLLGFSSKDDILAIQNNKVESQPASLISHFNRDEEILNTYRE